MHYPELDPDPEYENNVRRARMYPYIRTKRYHSGEEHMAYVSTTVRIDGVTQHTGNVTAMIVPPVMNLGYLQSLR